MDIAILMSIRSRWSAKIALREKLLEIRKTRPKIETPFRCFIYCTKEEPHLLRTADNAYYIDEEYKPGENLYGLYQEMNGTIIGEFICDKIIPIQVFENGSIQDWNHHNLASAQIPYDGMANYIGWGKVGYGWHISDLVLYDEPKKLEEFRYYNTSGCVAMAPQSWTYVKAG